LSKEQQREVCSRVSETSNLHESAVEKDFWICWTLRALFTLPECGHILTFKGGTSLSKGFGIINRFSEDIDIVVDRHVLGFGGENSPESAPSKKQTKARIEKLMPACRAFVHDTIQAALKREITDALGVGMNWSLDMDSGDPDDMTILFRYPAVNVYPGSVQPVVRIELGARSDTDPHRDSMIRPFVSDVLTEIQAFPVRTVAPERTFWEKAMLIHESVFGRKSAGPVARLARHYYDLHCLWEHGAGRKAAGDPALFERVATHRKMYFPRNAEAQRALQKGTLQLVPDDRVLPDWRRDYDAMREMFYGDPPEFKELIQTAAIIQHTFNQ
jgi:hypothetical protein